MTMETGLFEIQADHLSEFRQTRQTLPTSRGVVCGLLGRADPVSYESDPASHSMSNGSEVMPRSESPVNSTVDLARCFLRVANLPNFAFDRLSRYEATLWRQTAQILYALDVLDRRKPQERRRRFSGSDSPELPRFSERD
jgi:hypothetical protein